ncbi:MAG: hypothetical protein ACUVX9_18130 [Anaerolineae bacterium]
MTYCPNKWICGPTYIKIMQEIQARMGEASQQEALSPAPYWVGDGRTVASRTSGDYLFVTGYIDTVAARATLDALYVESDVTPPHEPVAGGYAIALYDGDDELLADYEFTPAQLIDAGSHLRVISEWIPWDEDTARVAVISGTRELAMVPVSANAPTVELTEPNGGETLNGATTSVEWEGADADGGNLEYLLQYSADGGAGCLWRLWCCLKVRNRPPGPFSLGPIPDVDERGEHG